jgi:hypothetical protein
MVNAPCRRAGWESFIKYTPVQVVLILCLSAAILAKWRDADVYPFIIRFAPICSLCDEGPTDQLCEEACRVVS